MNLKKIILKPLVESLANFLGFDLIPHSKEQHPDRLLKRALQHYNINLILDVGANHGQFAEKMRHMGFDGTILSFEPAPAAFQDIQRKSVADPGWICVQTALGQQRGELTLNCHQDDSLNSFLQTNELAENRFQAVNPSTEIVPVERLDAILATLVEEGKIPDNFRAFLKLDTQGFDLEVIRGMAGSVDHVFVVQSEASVNPIYDPMPGYRETFSELDAIGFKPAAFATVSRDRETLQLIEFDLIAIRNGRTSVEQVTQRLNDSI